MSNGAVEADPTKDLVVGPFAAAMVLTATWLAGLAGEEGWRFMQARKGKAATGDACCSKRADAGDAEACVRGDAPERRIAEALAQEAAAAVAAAQASASRAAELLAALDEQEAERERADAAARAAPTAA